MMSRFETVLIVDDDPSQIAILQAYFASLRARKVLAASNPVDALDVLDRHEGRIDLIGSDLAMPRMDGFEFLRHLRDRLYAGHIALFSGHHSTLLKNATELARKHELKILGYVRKPLTKSALDEVFSRDIRPKNAEEQGSRIDRDSLIVALDNRQIGPLYQPKVDLTTGRVVGAEALARWHHPLRGMISPALFIHVAENSGLIDRLTFDMLDQILDDMERHRKDWDGIKISINMPPHLMDDLDLPDRLSEKCARKGIANNRLCLEITESSVINTSTRSLEVLSRLAIKGFELSIDDFGTGASNIANLRVVPYSELKIDRSFTANFLTDAFSEETVRTSVALAKQLDMRVVAEGVDNMRVLEALKARGIHQAQGFLISKPVSAEDVSEFFRNRSGWRSKAA